MDMQFLFTIAGSIIAASSILTNVIPTPAADAPSWQRYGYQVIEFLALVGTKTKENPDAAKAAALVIAGLEAGDVAAALDQAVTAYQALTGTAAKAAG